MLNYIRNLFDENKSILKKTYPIVKKINSYADEMKNLSDQELEQKTQEFKKALKDGKTLDDILPEAFAVVKEVSTRATGLTPYDVQLIGGILLHQGRIAEMKTGEGKTLVATLPTYLNALEEKGAHIVTVNDYLSRRDAVWVGQIFAKLGLSVGVINSDNQSYLYDPTYREQFDEARDELGSFKVVYEFLKPCDRKEAYKADITYGTNSEFGFDYLRDNITADKEDLRQRDLNFAIVDEIDSILIDEARVPLIISAGASENRQIYITFAEIAKQLNEGEDFEKDEKTKSIIIKDSGIDKAEKALGIDNLYSEKAMVLVDHLETALKAKALYKKEKEYVIKNGEAVIVDEFTGRMQDGRRWSDGLHQAIEAKEGLEIKEESRTFASVTYQNFFKMYKKLSGMTGTAETSKEEFFKVYHLDVVVVPTNKPVTRVDKKDLIFATENGKFEAIANKIQELYEKGQPVLVGTASVEKSELLSEFLVKKGIKHTILNAKNHESEGEIIANAGKKSAVTIATNMAGRGVDIKLGGALASEEEKQEVLKNGGLYILGTERHESRRIDNQLRGRSGRQGDVGETQFYISLDDHLMRVFGNQEFMKKILLKKVELEGGEDKPIESKIMSSNVEKAQEKIEGFHFDARKHVLEYDDVLDVQRKAIYKKRRDILLAENEDIFEFFKSEFKDNQEFLDQTNQKIEKLNRDDFLNFIKKVYLTSIDTIWVEHLNVMEHLKSAVSLQSYGQKDPVVEYKKEAKKYFENIFEDIKGNVLKNINAVDPDQILANLERQTEIERKAKEAVKNSERAEEGNKKKKPIVKKNEEKIGRNDKCPCGSGKKYKNCCMKH
ncbi:preprotein translocase subunit SecA [Candidatus Campbellbacteria bacterium]|nr:MAG: preprotein translocase subunit SecA [Candidatus Campbellbacteria bacterium]